MRKSAVLSFLWLTCVSGVQSVWADDPHGYLALGDSLAFGYSPLVVPAGDLNKYHGYPQLVADHVQPNKLANASCFGETSGHFLNTATADLGCGAWRSALPLFVSYTGTQMDYAVQYLKSHSKTGLVTIDLGLNDLGVLLSQCGASCTQADVAGVLGVYAANMGTIYSRIRIEAGYKGPIVAVTAYAFNYADPVQTGAIAGLNATLSAVSAGFGVKIADAFTIFGAAALPFGGSVCPTGLLVKTSATTCDTHPSAKGQAVLANLVLSALSH